MGNGRRINFWNDHWTEFLSLKVAFPRIYGIAIKKSGAISEFGQWVNSDWVWNIELRRNLFVWEMVIWSNFIQVLNRGTVASPGVDRLKWLGSSNGKYNSKTYCIKLETINKSEYHIWNYVWNKFVPPKVAAFVWKTIYQRLPVASELVKRAITCNVNLLCLFYKHTTEDVWHVLCHCDFVWQVWQRWCLLWKVQLVFPMKVRDLLEIWFSQRIRRHVKDLWQLGFFGLIWQIWLCRNKARFNGLSFTVEQIYNNVLLQIGVTFEPKLRLQFCLSSCLVMRVLTIGDRQQV
ncbi:uncharacterized protein LOC120140520 [Hibiscus syriacus]|uniref:uncharacterized protein LOC120140520 n=1 Tax=Hibiscus syriacus TaxID=106335 RepID=UPI001922BE96|nr:uncharacterized protein LOC120140520 [Hibiscus syriacus]